MAYAYPSPTNVYVPSFGATGQLTVSYSRNPKTFRLNQWTTLTPVTKMIGLYLRFNADQAARIIKTDLGEFLWKDGAEAPTGNWALESFTWVRYISERYCYPFTMGRITVDQAEWPVVAQHSAFSAQLAMTARTTKAAALALNSSNYASNHVFNQTAAKWNTGTTSNPVIKIALNNAAQQIQVDTLGMVGPDDLCLVLSPALASTMAESAEIQDYLKGSPFALAQIRGDVPGQNGQWGLPDMLYNYKIVVEDAVRNFSLKGVDPQDKQYIWSPTSAALLARPGALVGAEGTPSFSSIHLFVEEEMTAEVIDDPTNRRVLGRIVDNFAAEYVTNLSAALFTNCQAA